MYAYLCMLIILFICRTTDKCIVASSITTLKKKYCLKRCSCAPVNHILVISKTTTFKLHQYYT